jgi:hypothetical protein
MSLKFKLFTVTTIIATAISCAKNANGGSSDLFETDVGYQAYYETSESLFTNSKKYKSFVEWTKRNATPNIGTNIRVIQSTISQNQTGMINIGIGRKIYYGISRNYITTDRIGVDTAGVLSNIFNSAAPSATPLPIHFSIRASHKMEYSREARDLNSAVFMKIKNPLDLPLSSENAINKMNIRDLLSIPVRMGFSLGLGKAIQTTGGSAGAVVGVFWVGNFRLNIFKRDESHIIVSLVPETSQGFRATAGGSTTLAAFGISSDGTLIGMPNMIRRGLIKQIERGLGFNILSFNSTNVQKGQRMVLEYSFNMTTEHGRIAYDKFIKNTKSLKWLDPRIFNPKDPDKLAFADLTYMENLHRWSYENGYSPDAAPVYRHVRYSEQFNGLTTSGHIGFKPLRYKGYKAITNHLVSTTDAGGNESIFSISRFNTSHRVDSWINDAEMSNTYDAWSISETSDNLRFKALVIDTKFTDEKILDKPFGNYRNSLRTVMSGPWYDGMKLGQALRSPDEVGVLTFDRFSSKIRFTYNEEFVNDLNRSLLSFPNEGDAQYGFTPKELFYKRLQWAASTVYKDANQSYQRTLPANLRLPLVFIDNILGRITNSIKKTYDVFTNLGWVSGEDKVLNNLINIMMKPRNEQIGSAQIASETIHTLDDAASAPRVVPGFLNALCSQYKSCKPLVKIDISRKKQAPYNYKWNDFGFDRTFVKLKELMRAPQRDPVRHYYK